MEIDFYLSKLLMDYDCVIIPDFGGFVANTASAKIHPTQHIFEPPYKQIAFNKNLTNNDGLLANSVASEKTISFTEANKWIEQEVLRIEMRLAKREKVELKNVGVLFFDVERNLQFTPSNSINYLLDSFGLASFQSPAIKRENYVERIEKSFKDRPAIANEIKKQGIKKYWPVLVALPLVAFMILVPLKSGFLGKLSANYSNLNPFEVSEKIKYTARTESTIFEMPVEKTISSALENEGVATVVNIALTEDSLQTIPVRMNTIAAAETTFVAPAEKPIQSRLNNLFHLIAGCFKEKENAEAMVNELKVKGFDASIVGQNNIGLYRVSYHTFNDATSARAALAELKTENPGAWLYHN